MVLLVLCGFLTRNGLCGFGSLQGPFADKFLGTWKTTSQIEYHRLLPYAELISSWLPRFNHDS